MVRISLYDKEAAHCGGGCILCGGGQVARKLCKTPFNLLRCISIVIMPDTKEDEIIFD